MVCFDLLYLPPISHQTGTGYLCPVIVLILACHRIRLFNMATLCSSFPGGHNDCLLSTPEMAQIGIYSLWPLSRPGHLLSDFHEKLPGLKDVSFISIAIQEKSYGGS
jgi:hypothetical protein